MKKFQSGFTMMEMLVTMTLIVMIMLVATSVFLITMVGNNKNAAVQVVKQEGEYALGQIEFLIRNAIEITSVCEADMTEIEIRSVDNGVTRIFKELDESDSHQKIASNSGVYLTSSDVEITTGPEFDCSETSSLGSKYVEVKFTLRKGTPGVDQARDIIEEDFATGVNLRSF